MEIAIVGAGPAGAWAAYTLARRGVRVTLFDPSHPREKPCGGGITGRALELIGGAILPRVSSIRAARFIDSRRGRSAIVPLETRGGNDERALEVTSRAVFDRALVTAATAAGASWVAARVTDIAVGADQVRIDTTRGAHHAAFVIGADGVNSLVRRRVASPFSRSQLSMATGFFARGVTSDEIVLELVADPPGYIWSFPRSDHLAIGICAQAAAGLTAAALRARAADWIRATRIAGTARLDTYSWPIPSLRAPEFGALTLAGPRWCLVGDAAGLVDPLTREGIHFALLSGKWAAEAITGPDASRTYRQRVQDEIAPELARAARAHAAFFHPALTRLLIEALESSAGIRAVMADLIAGRQRYATLKWRLLKTFEVGLACRALSSLNSPPLA